jgi:hypothetical protein
MGGTDYSRELEGLVLTFVLDGLWRWTWLVGGSAGRFRSGLGRVDVAVIEMMGGDRDEAQKR